MTGRILPNLGLKAFYATGESDWGADMSLNLLKLSVLTQGGVLGMIDPLPSSPNAGDVYVVTTVGSNHNDVAVYDNGAWVYFTPQEGWMIYDKNTSEYISFNGTAWVVFSSGSSGGGSGSGGIEVTGLTFLHLATSLTPSWVWYNLIFDAVDTDTVSAFNTSTGVITVPAGTHYMRATGRFPGSGTATAYAVLVQGTSYNAANIIVSDQGGAAADPPDTNVQFASGWLPVTPGEQIIPVYNPGAAGVTLYGSTTPVNGEYCYLQIEWAETMALSGGSGGQTPWDYQPPRASIFTMHSGDSNNLSLTDDSDVGLIMVDANSTTGNIQRIAMVTLTIPADDWALVVKSKSLIDSANYALVFPLVVRDPIGGLIQAFGYANDGGLKLCDLPGLTGFTSEPTTSAPSKEVLWFKVAQISGTLYYYISANGKYWLPYANFVTSSYFTNPPAEIGIGVCQNRSGGWPLNQTIEYWSLTGPGV